MGNMRIKVHKERCISSGSCVSEAPQLFAQDEDGLVALRICEPSASDYDAARAAAAACPAVAIELEEVPEP
jgi:ferredoxin